MVNSRRSRRIIIGLGSNQDPENHILKAQCYLESAFENMMFSNPMWTDPIGMPNSAKFLNVVGVGYCRVGEEGALHALKDIERRCGRIRVSGRLGVIPLDADLLFYDDHFCHEKDWERDYILKLVRQMEPLFTEEDRAMLADKIVLNQQQSFR